MRFPLILLLVLMTAIAPRVSAKVEMVQGPVELRLKYGDDPRWAAPDWDDRDWKLIPASGLPRHAGIYWLRIRLVRPAGPTQRSPALDFYNFEWPGDRPGAPIDSVTFNSLLSFDFYWDGRLLDRGGVPGNSLASEVVGPLDHLIRIPDDLRAPGEHVLALRLSTYHYNLEWIDPFLAFRLDNYASRLIYETRRPFLPLVGTGVSLLMAITCLLLTRFFGRRRALLLCSALGAALALFYALVALRWVYNAPYDWHGPRLNLITFVMAGIGFLLPWVLLEHFGLPHRRRWLLALVPFLALSCLATPLYGVKAFWLTRTMLVAAIAIAGWAARQRKPGARPVLAAAVVGLLMVSNDGRTMLDTTFFVIVSAVMIFVLAAIGWQFQQERRRGREAVLVTARLETELLKKNLQPHFLLNTLTAISEVIEQDPPGAVRFIGDLADEFRSLARMSGEKLVPLTQELELCRAHLRVIARRTGRLLTLEQEIIEDHLAVPPAVFLTLVENGLIHQQADSGAIFRLRQERTAGSLRYTFLSPGTSRGNSDRPAGGTGLRYVRARLEESFPGRWTFTQSPVAGGWETVVAWSS